MVFPSPISLVSKQWHADRELLALYRPRPAGSFSKISQLKLYMTDINVRDFTPRSIDPNMMLIEQHR
jgi:hypothetical protein